MQDTLDRPTRCRYDADGNLILACDNGSAWLTFDGNNVSGAALVGTNKPGWQFFHGPGLDDPLMGYYRPVGATTSRLLYFVTNGQGRQFAVADSTGNANPQDYSDINALWRYAGGTRQGASFDAERQSAGDIPTLSYFRNRAYDQVTGRWTQEDPIGVAGGLNLYQFNSNNPVAYTDPFGLCPEKPCRSPDDPLRDRQLPEGVAEKDVTWDPNLGQHGGYWHDKDGRQIIPEPETEGHYDRWRVNKPGIRTPSFAPDKSRKPLPGQKRLKPDQSWSDPNDPAPMKSDPVGDVLDWIYRHIPPFPTLSGVPGAATAPGGLVY